MAKCAYCGSETELFNNGVAVCLKCSDDHEGKSKPPQTELALPPGLTQTVKTLFAVR